MKKCFLGLLFFLAVSIAQAQDETVRKLRADAERDLKKETDTLPKKWRTGGVISVNLAQGSLNNWAAGGDAFSLTINSIISAYAFYKEGRHSWDNTFDVNMGYLRTTSLGSRKNDDRIDLLSKYGYGISSQWNLATLLNFRTQALKGYDYDDGERTLLSDFLSPAYLLLSQGFDYKPVPSFSIFLSPLTARFTFLQNDSLAARGLYGVPAGQNSNTEVGAFLTAAFLKEFNPVVSYKARLDLFSNYRHNPQNIDVFMTNLLTAKITKLIAVSWNVDVIYDDDVRIFGEDGTSPATQLKSIFGIGLMLKF